MSITITINADTQDPQTIAALETLANALHSLAATTQPDCCLKRPITERGIQAMSDILIHAHQKPRRSRQPVPE